MCLVISIYIWGGFTHFTLGVIYVSLGCCFYILITSRGQNQQHSSLTVEDVLCVIGPDPVIRVMTDGGRGQRRIAGHNMKAAL